VATVAADWPRPGPAAPPSRTPPGGTPRPGPWRYRLTVGCLALALAGLCLSLTEAAWHLLPRSFSPAQQRQITSWEVGKRWRTWPAGRIFPAVVPYQIPATALASPTGVSLDAHRIGIAPQGSCRAAAGPLAGQALARQGCVALLRATYADATGAFAVTVGIAVLPGPAQASRSLRALAAAPPGGGVRAARFSHTVAAGFGDAGRQLSATLHRGPYLIMSTIGYADGRHHIRESADPYARDEMLSVVRGISSWIGGRIGVPPRPPHCPGGPAC
jgi:hypothetical protein